MSDIKKLADDISNIPTASMGITETLDMFKMMDAFLDAYEKAMADGKLDFEDLQYATPAIVAAIEAFKGADKIALELKDLDAAEATQLFQKVFSLMQRLIKTIAAKDVMLPTVSFEA
jgi:hypothetical protein